MTSKITASTRLYGILGNPVRHSLSPLIHNAVFESLGMDCAYMAFEVNGGFLGLAFDGIRSLGIAGVNITVPYKEEAMGFLDEVPEDIDRCMGAVNTVVNKNGQLFGYNTDGPGFLEALSEELSFNPEGKTALVLGAGGAARGILFALARAHADRIFILNRTPERAEGLAELMEPYFPDTEIAVQPEEEVRHEKVDIVVNATSCGMTPSPDWPAEGGPIAARSLQSGDGVKAGVNVPIDLRILSHKTAVYDTIYSPAETLFLKQAKALGLPAANGLGMLVNQAALSFELWTGKKEGVQEAMRQALKGRV